MATWEETQAGIFAGESGGDYNALYGYANRPGGQFSDVRLTEMTLDQALEFSAPSGAYGQSVKGQIGRVATPMGAYQVVGTTLRDAKRGLGLTGAERMTPELQDAIGQWILATQGTGAWEGYRGPGTPTQQATGAQNVLAQYSPQQAQPQNALAQYQAQPMDARNYLMPTNQTPRARFT